jgi:hypothetical protein
MNKTRIFVGISLIGMGITLYSLGYSKLLGELGNGTITIYPAAALALLGALALWSAIRQQINA